jgi:hypothetical protein
VKEILNGVLDELISHPHRKFTLVDMKFVHMWYKNLKDEQKKELKRLIQNG